MVGLLWADQNLKDFGDQHRLLLSKERAACFNLLNNLNQQELEEAEGLPYFQMLNEHQAHVDNIFTTDFIKSTQEKQS